MGVPVLVLALPPAGLLLGLAQLRRRYPDRDALPPAPLPIALPGDDS
jgi:hypothetical protein